MAAHGIPAPVELTADEAPQSDVGLGLARIDGRTRHALDIEPGGFLEIVGRRSTVASVSPLAAEDEGKEVIRIDTWVRRNAKIPLGGKVVVRKVDVEPAKKVVLAPVMSEGHMISFGDGVGDFVKRGLLKRPLTIGDVVIVTGIALMGGPLPFVVFRVKPEARVQVLEVTAIEVRERPLRPSEVGSPEERFKEIVDRAADSLSTLMVELEGATGEQSRSLRDRIRALLDVLRGTESR